MIPKEIKRELEKYLSDGYRYIPSNNPRVYIAGPMRSCETLNFNAFFEAEERLKNKGYIVINPARNPMGLTPAEYMQIDLSWVCICDYIYMLEGWERSEGATTEFNMAKSLGKNILYEKDDCEFDVMDKVENDYNVSVEEKDWAEIAINLFEVICNEQSDLIKEPDPELIKEIEEFIEEVEAEWNEGPCFNGSVFYIFNCYEDDYDYRERIEERTSYLNNLGLKIKDIVSYDPFLDKQRIEQMDYFFRFNGWEEEYYNIFLSEYAKSIGKTIIDE